MGVKVNSVRCLAVRACALLRRFRYITPIVLEQGVVGGSFWDFGSGFFDSLGESGITDTLVVVLSCPALSSNPTATLVQSKLIDIGGG